MRREAGRESVLVQGCEQASAPAVPRRRPDLRGRRRPLPHAHADRPEQAAHRRPCGRGAGDRRRGARASAGRQHPQEDALRQPTKFEDYGPESARSPARTADDFLLPADHAWFPAGRRYLQSIVDAQMTSTDGTSHLFAFGEFAAMYLSVWSNAVWTPLRDPREAGTARPADGGGGDRDMRSGRTSSRRTSARRSTSRRSATRFPTVTRPRRRSAGSSRRSATKATSATQGRTTASTRTTMASR